MTALTQHFEFVHGQTPARRLIAPAVLAGLLGGLVLAMGMMIVMGTAGMGFWSPLNLGMPAFVFRIAPPLAMLPLLVTAMGISLPPSMMSQLGAAVQSGHVSSAMASKFGALLLSMHVPAARVHVMGLIMSGHATNSTVTNLLASMNPTARNAVMRAMPLNATPDSPAASLPATATARVVP